VLINGTSWHVVVLTKSKLAVPVIEPVKLLHARLGHIALSTMQAVVRTGLLHTGISATVNDVSAAPWLMLGLHTGKMHRTKHGWRIMSGLSRWIPQT